MNLLYFWTGGANAWIGSTATIGIEGVSGRFALALTGSQATVGVEGVSGQMITRLGWIGSVATIGVDADSGEFSGSPRPLGRTGIMVLGRSKVETLTGRGRTGMMVGTGRSRTGD